MDKEGFTLDRPKSSFTRRTSQEELIITKDGERGYPTIEMDGEEGVGGRQTIQITTKSETIALSRASSAGADATAGGETNAAMEDFSSSDADRTSISHMKKGRKTKEQLRKQRKQKNADRLSPFGGSYSSAGERVSQSAFPISTPDRLGPLSDLLEEEIVLPGESRDTSASTDGRGVGEKEKLDAQGGQKKEHGNWAYLPPPRSPTTSTTSSESVLV